MSVKKQEHNLLSVLVQKLRKIMHMQNIAYEGLRWCEYT